MRGLTLILGPSSFDRQNAGKISLLVSLSHARSLFLFPFLSFCFFLLLYSYPPNYFCLFPHLIFFFIFLLFIFSFIHFSFLFFDFFLHELIKVGKTSPLFSHMPHVISMFFLLYFFFIFLSLLLHHLTHGSI